MNIYPTIASVCTRLHLQGQQRCLELEQKVAPFQGMNNLNMLVLTQIGTKMVIVVLMTRVI